MTVSRKILTLTLAAMSFGSLCSLSMALARKASSQSASVLQELASLRKDSRPDSIDYQSRKKTYFFTEAVRQKNAGNYTAAIDLLTECYYIDANDAAVAFEFADIYAKVGDNEKAMKMTNLAASLDDDNLWYKMSLAELYLKNKNPQGAIEIYKDLEKKRPDLEDINYRLAGLYLQTNQLDQGLAALNRLEKKVGVDENITLEKYHFLQLQGKKEKAVAEIEKLSKTYPLNVDYKLYLAVAYLSDSNYQSAATAIDEADKIEPNNEKVLAQKLALYTALGQNGKADTAVMAYINEPKIEVGDKLQVVTDYFSNATQVDFADRCFQSLVKQYPDNALTHAYYSTFCLMQRKDTAAEEQLKEFVRLAPDQEQGWQDLISIYMQRNDMSSLKSTCSKALTCLPESPSILAVNALCYSMEGNMEASLSNYRKSASAYERYQPGNKSALADVYMYIGDLYAQNNLPDSAFAYYEKSYVLNPGNALMLNNFAYYLSVYNRDLDRAEQMSALSLKADANNVSYLDTYAWIFFRKKDYSMAKIFMQQALDKGGLNNATCLEHYGDILYMSGDKDEAITWWRKALEMGGPGLSKTINKKIETGTYVE